MPRDTITVADRLLSSGESELSFPFSEKNGEGVMYMVTWELLFQLCLVIAALFTLFIVSVEFIVCIIITIFKNKK